MIGKVFFQNDLTLFRRLFVQISHLYLSDHLRAFKGKEFIESAELHTRTVQIRSPDVP